MGVLEVLVSAETAVGVVDVFAVLGEVWVLLDQQAEWRQHLQVLAAAVLVGVLLVSAGAAAAAVVSVEVIAVPAEVLSDQQA